MEYNIVSAKTAIKNLIEKERKITSSPTGFVYCEGSFAFQCMLDLEFPGNYLVNRGLKFESKFEKFERIPHTNGSMCGTETTCIAVWFGNINKRTVLFVYPTSQKVDHEEVESYLKEHFPNMFFVEYDQNFTEESLNRAERRS